MSELEQAKRALRWDAKITTDQTESRDLTLVLNALERAEAKLGAVVRCEWCGGSCINGCVPMFQVVDLSKENESLRAEIERLNTMWADWHREAVDKEDDIMARLHKAEAKLKAVVENMERIVAVGTKLHSGFDSPSEAEMLRAYGEADRIARAALAAAMWKSWICPICERSECEGTHAAQSGIVGPDGRPAVKEKP